MTAVLAPRFFDDLWAMLNDQPEATLMAGGTDLLVRRRAGLVNPRTIVLLEGLDALAEISLDNGELVVGSGATHSRILNSPLIRTNAPLLAMALAKVGGPQIRNMGTIGGNLCTASPAGDSLPALHVLGARVELLSQNARRVMNLDEFILGPGKTALRPGEILTRILVPPTRHFQVQHFEKVGQRKAMAIAVVSLAGLISLGPRGLIENAHLALGSVGPTIIRPVEA
ncbi:MAG: xanthine dehydrogenase family protein subunit M, partial [Deltaproteobacteria bacterium]|nr:xanthine dehydrogenase family protein subunit M [Deltaproteobacteria bacterium]